MIESERMALAARLHVALRRKSGRVTDTEWMVLDPSYAAEMVRVARAHAAETADAGLAGLASEFEAATASVTAEQWVRADTQRRLAAGTASAPQRILARYFSRGR